LCRFHKHLDAVDKLLKAEFKKDHSIKSMTFHASKGLQAEHVYVIDPRFRWMGFTDANEELCNMYVALSRAKRWLTIIRSTAATVDNKDDKNYRKRNLLDEIDSKLCEII
jgi:superfamily I DNA/RNA helicase